MGVFCHRVCLVYFGSHFLLSRSSTMAFGDLKTEKGVEALTAFLENKSYIEGYAPSQADVATLNALSKAPASSFPHALRWFNHIKSFGVTLEIYDNHIYAYNITVHIYSRTNSRCTHDLLDCVHLLFVIIILILDVSKSAWCV